MKFHKFSISAVLASAICLVSVFGLVGNVQAWSWYGFSALHISDTVRGREGSIINFKLTGVVINAQCYNVNTGNLTQPGVGNYGGLELTADTFANPSKDKGTITVDGYLYLDRWDDHSQHVFPEDHLCWPYSNINKEERPGTGWISEFVAEWWWYDGDGEDAKLINHGFDTCTLDNPQFDNDGFPIHDLQEFECTSTSDKNIKYVLE